MKKPLTSGCNTALASAVPFISTFYKKIALPLFLGCLIILGSFTRVKAQTQFWSDTFEDSGAPSTGSRTPSLNTGGGGPPLTYYFIRTDGTNLALNAPFTGFETLTTYQGAEGSKFWAGEDTDRVRSGANDPADKVQTIEWPNINISGKTGITFKGLFAALQSQGWQNKNSFPTTYDLLEVEYSIDGGAWIRAGGFYGGTDAVTGGVISEDTNNDYIGDGTNLLSRQFKEVTWSISGTGTTMSLRFRASADAGATQEFAIDNFRLFQAAAPLTATTGQANVACNGGSNGVASVIVSGGTAPYTYSWAPSGGTNSSATGLAAGTYTVTITDNSAAQITRTFTITQPSALSASMSQTNVSCNGGSNGVAVVTASGGTAPYTYSWSPSGGTNAAATGLAVGTYTVTITDNNACQTTRTFTITQPSALSVTTSQADVSCNGGTNGVAHVSVSGGAGGYTYSWAPSGGNGATASGLAAGTYTVTISDANTCQTTRTFTITQPSALTVSSSQTNVSCNGGNNGAAIVSVSGGAGGYTYSWAPSGGNAAIATGLAVGTYTVTITDANSCTTTKTFTITQPSVLSATAASLTNVSTFGGNDGSATVSVSGGTPGYTYSWAPSGGTAATASGLTAGTYTVTVTDNNGCTDTQNFVITQPAGLTVTTSQTNVSCNGGGNGTATVNVSGGASPYTYSWSPSGGTGATASGLAAGTYTVTITDNNLTQTTRTFNITQPAGFTVSTSRTNVSCNGGSNGTATISVSGGTPGYTYSWSPSGGNGPTASGLTAGTYTVTVTDANTCQTTSTFIITEPVALTVSTSQTNVSCNGGTNGTASVNVSGGTPGYTYSWAPAGGTAATATGLAAGTYTVTITDNNTCQTTRTFTITQPPVLVATPIAQTNIACNGSATGSATVSASGGTGSYTYLWSPAGGTAATATGLTAGTYTVTVTDANSCTATQSFTITQPPVLAVSPGAQTNIACNGSATGSATVSVSGGTPTYTYLWAPAGGTAATATGLTAGTYTVTVTDANGCMATQSFTIAEPAALSATTSQTNVSCNGGSNGMASVSVSGGTPTYTYSWAPAGGTASTASGLTAGTYTVTITDNNGCTTTKTFTITQPVAFSVTTSQTNVSCNGGSNGSATVTVSGGTPTYTYSWAPAGGTAATATGLTAGTYTVTITDANLCTTTKTFTITQPPALVVTPVVQTNIACNGSATGSATVNVSGGTGTYTYSWAPAGGTAATATGLTAGTYTVTVTDANGCTGTQSFTITQPIALIATPVAQSNVSCNGGSNGWATVAVSGGTPGYTYSWAPAGGTGITAAGLTAGTYTVTITDANACTTTQSFTITQPVALSATTSQTNVSCNGGSNGSATVTVSGGTPTYTYSWAPAGGTAATATGLTAGTYTVTITDANLCTTTKTFTITQPPALTVTASAQTNIACNGSATGSATVNVSGGTPGYTYSWAPAGGTAATASGLTAGTYTVTVTDANGCMGTQSFTITQPPVLVATPNAQNNVSCNGGSNGSATVNVSGGTPGYTYSWAPSGGTAATASGLTAGTYTVTITDANGCTTTQSFTITQPIALTSTISATSPTSYGGSNGTATVVASGGTPGYTYSWAPAGGTAATATGLTAGTYTATITDNNGCTSTKTVEVYNPIKIDGVSASNADGNYKGGSNIAIEIGFPEAVFVDTSNGAPTLALNTGETATYTSGSGSTQLIFTYTVGAVQVADLDYSSTLALNLSGGTITVASNSSAPIDFALPNPGSAGSLGANKNIAVDGILPVVTAMLRNGSSPTNAHTVRYDLTFSESINDIDASDFSPVVTGTLNATVSSITGSGANYAVYVAVDGTGTLRLDVKASGTGIIDLFGNELNGGYSAGEVYDIDQTPLISTSGTLSALSTTYGTASSNTTFSVSAVNLTAPVTLTAPSGFELSTDPASGFTTTMTVGTTDALVSTAIYVRLKADATVPSSPYTGNITLSTPGGNTVNVATLSSTVIAKPITVSLNASPLITKVYDASTTATLVAGNYTLSGLIGSDEVTVSGQASYADANIGNSKTVTVNTFVLAGTEADNYNLTTINATTTGNITIKELTVTLNASPLITKVYDGSTTATLEAANYSLHGLAGSDQLSITGTASYNNKNAGTGKVINVNTFVLSGVNKDNYKLLTLSINTKGDISPISLLPTLSDALPIEKTYDGNTTAALATGNFILTDLISGDEVGIQASAANYDNKEVGTQKTITATGLTIVGKDAGNYKLSITQAKTSGTILKAQLTISADDKERFSYEPNPVLTASYQGWVNGEGAQVLDQQPSLSTTATSNSPAGNYPINISGASAANYSLSYVPGILKIKISAPTTISFSPADLFENQPSGALAGTLSANDPDPQAQLSYTLVNGVADNALFSINANQIFSTAVFNYEQRNNYRLLVKVTNKYGLSIQQEIEVNIGNVNEVPTLSPLANVALCYTATQQSISLTGISAGEDQGQTVSISVSSNLPALFSLLEINGDKLNYRLANNAIGTATLTVTVKDNGGTSHGGTDSFSRTFTLQVNPQPQVSISTNIGANFIKGQVAVLTASGGTNYQWANASGIISGQNTATLTVQPTATTTYSVTASNATGCSSTVSITLTVSDEPFVVEATNIMSPNGDGINDFWVIKDIGLYPNNLVQVFDRGQRLVYSKKSYKNEWDATFKGLPLAEGTYYYIIDLGDGKTIKRGFITIVRRN
ncbi:MAG: YDG domain-containing protein [Bacteroidota bacterium]